MAALKKLCNDFDSPALLGVEGLLFDFSGDVVGVVLVEGFRVFDGAFNGALSFDSEVTFAELVLSRRSWFSRSVRAVD